MDTPIARGETLSLEMCPRIENQKEDMSRVPYSSVVGSLMYVMMCTRPDICYVVGLVSRYQSNPGRDHWKAVNRIFKYLKGTANYSLCYSGNGLYLRAYTDADWAGDRNDRKSTSGYAFLLNGGAISWKSKKQTCTTLSTMEFEFVACASVVQKAVWLKRFFEYLDITKNS
ncbi:secreted RxLR effector protein 161-like [Nicotiana tabacum]|uniref:Secreted RxLR effector protein 161-like n=1 Tax=Nicotiana tabacum TaxID=4097 RepID=A0AC58RPU7_TOBAC